MQKELKQLNSMGLIAGDEEDEKSFLERVALFRDPSKVIESMKLPIKREDYSNFFDRELLKSEYDLDPTWVYLWCSNQELMPWEAASTWVVELKKNVPFPILQFRKGMKQRKSYMGYSYQEIFMHEMIHAARTNLKSKTFEEIMAYDTSKNRLRRWLGPIFQTPHESILYMVCWSVAFGGACLYMFTELFYFMYLFETAFAVSLGMTLYGLIRLISKKRLFKRAKKQIEKLFGKANSKPLLIRLNDEEVKWFATGRVTSDALDKKRETSLKWKQIFASYMESTV